MANCKIYENCGRDCNHCEVIKATNKQIPKEPNILRTEKEKLEGQIFTAHGFECPTCNKKVICFGGMPNYCDNCGQAIFH